MQLAQVAQPDLSCIVAVAAAKLSQEPQSAAQLLQWSDDGNATHVDAQFFKPFIPDGNPIRVTLRATLPMRDGQSVTNRFVYTAQNQPVVGMPLLIEALVRANQQAGNLGRGDGLAPVEEDSANYYMSILTNRNATRRMIASLDDATLSGYLSHIHDGLLVVVNSGDSNVPGPLHGEGGVPGIVEKFFYNVVDTRGSGANATAFLLRNPFGDRPPTQPLALSSSLMGEFWLTRDEVRRAMTSIAVGETDSARFARIDPSLISA